MRNKRHLKKLLVALWSFFRNSKPLYAYRVCEIAQDKKGDYYVVVQMVSKYRIFKMKPEEILANDAMTLQFSPLDVRALTYLGYLGINSPKYKVLAKHLSAQEGMVFSVYSKEKDAVEIKKANEIVADKEIWQNLDRDDLPEIAYSAGGDDILNEREQIRKLKEAEGKSNDKT